MDNETMLPMDWKPLREAAEANARETHDAYAAVHRGYAAWDDLPDCEAMLDGDDPDYEGARIIGSPRRIFTDAHAALLADLTRPASRDFWVRWLAEKVGLTVGATAPGWTYTAASGRDSVAVWQLSCGGRHWALCDYPPDIERVLGPPAPYGDMISVRNLPSDPAAALRAALRAVVPA